MGLGNIFGGAARQITSDIEDRQKNAFALKLQNAAIEGQFRNASELDAQKALESSFSPEVSSGLGQLTGMSLSPDQRLNEGEGKVLGALASAGIRAGAAADHAATGKGKTENIGGTQYNVIRDKEGKIASMTPLGPSQQTADHIKQAEEKYTSYHNNMVDSLSKVQTFIQAQKATGLPGQWAKVTIGQLMQKDPNIKVYFDQLMLKSLNLDKELTGTSRFAANIGMATVQAFPQKTDTLPTALEKWQALDALGRHKLEATYSAYNVPSQHQKFPKEDPLNHPLAKEGQKSLDKRARMKEFLNRKP